jgi:hypothetical protein
LALPERNLNHLSDEYILSLRNRLRSKIAVTDGGCHLFTGTLDANGYGKIASKDAEGKYTQLRSHVASYLLNRGHIDAGLDVCHSCNVKNCVNPEHLYLGTRSENTQHACRDGLQKTRLTDEQVLEIYRLWHEAENRPTQKQLAERFGVDQPIVWRIVHKLAFKWAHKSPVGD